jgi:hypothetical protein
MKTKLFLAGLALFAVVSIVSGQNTDSGNKQADGSKKCVAYVDENKNGICDNFENRTDNSQSTQGTCHYREGKCNGNGTGICCGRGPGKGNGQGKGRNFIDQNKNGVCDNFESKNQKQ